MSIRQERKKLRGTPSRKVRRAQKRLKVRLEEFERNKGNRSPCPFTKPGSLKYH